MINRTMDKIRRIVAGIVGGSLLGATLMSLLGAFVFLGAIIGAITGAFIGDGRNKELRNMQRGGLNTNCIWSYLQRFIFYIYFINSMAQKKKYNIIHSIEFFVIELYFNTRYIVFVMGFRIYLFKDN